MNRAEDNSRSVSGMTLNSTAHCSGNICVFAAPCTRIITILPISWTLGMMPSTRKVTTACNGKRAVWTDYEEAKAYFLELMMTAEGENRDRAECVYIQLLHGLDECSDEDE